MTTTMIKVRAETLQVGDKIMPPSREVSLWMRRDIQERNLSESALLLTVTEIREGKSDKNGRWLVVSSDQSAEWNEGRNQRFPFRFKARPETLWQKVA
jgi:hypothetical protein